MNIRLLRPIDYQRMRWKNDLGWTTQIATFPPEATSDFEWRVSIAEIEQDCAFSTFPGYDRALIVIDGPGVELSFDAAPNCELHGRHRAAYFAGEWQTRCRLLGGSTRDFNVMTRRDTLAAQVLHRPLVGPMVFFTEPGTTWLVYLLAGHARLEHAGQRTAVESGETLLLHADDKTDGHAVLTGAGELLLVKFHPPVAQAVANGDAAI
jgi:uncharacterized protein